MFVSKTLSAAMLRMATIMFVATGLIMASGNLYSASAGSAKSGKIKIAKTNFNNSKKRVRKARSVKISYNKTRRALKRSKKSSLNKLSAKKHSKHRKVHYTGRRFRGLHPRLSRLLSMVKNHYGRPIAVSSGCRSYRHNRRVGGAKRSMHLRCMAADFKVAGVSKASLRRYVSRLPGRGGVGTYCGRSIVHLDVGPRRSWNHGCRKRRRRG